MRFGQLRHEIDRLHKELKQEALKLQPVESFKMALAIDKTFQDIVSNIDLVERNVLETVTEAISKAFVGSSYERLSS
jgi:hypothetical protein